MMKTYLKPQVDIEAFETNDIVLTSTMGAGEVNIDVGEDLL